MEPQGMGSWWRSRGTPTLTLEPWIVGTRTLRNFNIRGYFTIWIPTLVLALSLLMLSRYLIARYITGFALHAQAAMAILLSPVAVWTCRYEQNGWSLQWPYKTIWGEAALASICVGIFLMAPWEISRKMGLSALLGHCVFWYWFVSDGFHLPNSLNWEMPGL